MRVTESYGILLPAIFTSAVMEADIFWLLKGDIFEMDESIKNMLMDEVGRDIEKLETFDPDSDEYKKVAENICRLHKLIMDEKDAENKFETMFYEQKRKDEAQTKDHIIQYLRIGVEAAGIGLPLIFYAVWMHKGFKFEETGTITSSVFKNLISRFRTTP